METGALADDMNVYEYVLLMHIEFAAVQIETPRHISEGVFRYK